ncbi:unnamed protein product [Musa acuminata subsp. malaccensis]|uniref:(wild Malaysian banana) hypothetical protein n=1 Tax=Musa acuminata subsp. malaccensis TaxID=214687 RepID=A0A804IAS6_MUSAM|nr:unnamed protein product [Musa acuminata subsp. malaccensis]
MRWSDDQSMKSHLQGMMQMNLAKSCDAKDIDHRFDATIIEHAKEQKNHFNQGGPCEWKGTRCSADNKPA